MKKPKAVELDEQPTETTTPEASDIREKTEVLPEQNLESGQQADIFGVITNKLESNNEVKENTSRKRLTPEEREQRKKDREQAKLKEEQEKDQNLEMFFSPVLGEMFLNLYIIKVCKVQDNPAKEAEINAFTDSVKGIAKKYMTDAMKNNIELVNFALVMTSVTLSRVDIATEIKKLKGE